MYVYALKPNHTLGLTLLHEESLPMLAGYIYGVHSRNVNELFL